MNRSTTASRLKLLMRDKNLRQIDILNLAKPYCEQYGIKLTKTDLSQYISGKTEPKQNKLYVLALALNVSESWLMGLNTPMKRSSPESRTSDNTVPLHGRKKIPLLGDIACGTPIYAKETNGRYVTVDDDFDADFCLYCKGDSMIDAKIFDGDIVFVRQQDIVENGDVAVVIIDDEATLKRFEYDNKNYILTLKPENSKYDDLVFRDEALENVRVLGKAIACYRKIK